MDESWRKRQPTFHPHRPIASPKDLGPDDFRDVFGGPPRSVLFRHFSPKPYIHHDRFDQTVKKEAGTSHNPNFYSHHNMFQTVKKEHDTSHNPNFYNLDRNGLPVMQSEDGMSCRNTSFCESDHVSATRYGHKWSGVLKKEDHAMLCEADHVSTNQYGHNEFVVTKKRDEACYDIDFDKSYHNGFQMKKQEDFVSSGLNFHMSNNMSATTHYACNDFPVMKMDKRGFCNEAFGYQVLNKHLLDNGFHAFKREEGFYDDIYGSDIHNTNASLTIRSRSRSVSKHGHSESTAVSCDFQTDNGYFDGDDRGLASFAAKLRPITIPSRRYDSTPCSTISTELANSTLQFSPPLPHLKDNNNSNTNNSKIAYKNRCNNGSFCCFTQCETDSLDPSFRLSFQKPPCEDNSPRSFLSSYFPCKEVEKNIVLETDRGVNEKRVNEKGFFVMKMDGYVKLEKERSVGSETSAALDEAIAWAKERSMNQGKQIDGGNENFVGFRDWNEKNGKER